MAKKIVAKSGIKPDYTKYIYFCAVDKETGNLNIVAADRSARSKGKKE